LLPLAEASSKLAYEGESEPVDAEWLGGLLDELEPLLKNGNLDCMRLIEGLRKHRQFDLMISYMDDFEFEPALALLREIRGKMRANG